MRRLALLAALAAFALVVVAAAQAVSVQQKGLRVTFDGQLFPHALPRTHAAPVIVRLGGSVGTADGSRPPQLREISIAVNRAGRVSVAGLPVCPAGELEQTTSKAALAACRGALVGHGSFDANVDLTNAPQIPAHGEVLAFNSRVHGRPALLLHIYGSTPVRVTFVLPFEIARRRHGEFGTVFSTKIPRIASDLGYVTSIKLTLGRRYSYRGERRSFLSASCAAPAGFQGAVYQLAAATFSFANGQRLPLDLSSDCTVR